MKDATRTYKIAAAQTLDLTEGSAIKIKKLIVHFTGTSGATAFSVRGTGLFEYLAAGASYADFIVGPSDLSSNEEVLAGFYERKPSANASISFYLLSTSVNTIELGGFNIHKITAPTNCTVYAIAY